ncbi:flagellar hook protein FlgE [Diaminobutyricimonas aerilata]|uniref:Flagellar hook protein FlgE n=1 Tax=Diaminobutyricimonas aerilata TaxID=1162967 RepID=A0A2M9CN27_9MICO|nr:flagellar hook protein FlgE [Diaminobutyricimonas aerilata]PJJ73282.1 flagellar hook protein FlgE [Diaminobutyricimonas aerilata]
MLRSLYSGISGLRSHQTMLDVTGNNIANVNTTAFKASAVRFQDTLSQLVQGAGGPQETVGGTNPAQVGLGVRVAGISTNFTQGSTQATGRSLDMMISGDGFFTVQAGGETLYTRAGAFDIDPLGRLTSEGALVLGWSAVNGVVNTGGGIGPITIPRNAVAPAVGTDAATVAGNLPSDATVGTALTRDIQVYDDLGGAHTLTLTFTRTAAGWDVAGNDGQGGTATGAMTFVDGELATGGSLTVGGVTVDLSQVTGFAELRTVSIKQQNGREAGTLQNYTMSKDGTLIGSFSNGATQPLARLSLATFVNPGGLEKAGGSAYRATINSGVATLGTPGSDGIGELVGGALEMSNVDLSQEFTNLIVAQRGFQANARIITTSDEVLQELTNLKR